jgi:hypothetical protein
LRKCPALNVTGHSTSGIRRSSSGGDVGTLRSCTGICAEPVSCIVASLSITLACDARAFLGRRATLTTTIIYGRSGTTLNRVFASGHTYRYLSFCVY